MSAQLEYPGDGLVAPDGLRLVDLLLEEQRALTAVDEFADAHASLAHDTARYESLIPSGAPGEGQQYAFRVDLDACTGCKACVTACHNLNGLEPDEAWRRVGVVEQVPLGAPGVPEEIRQHTVTTACHHCEAPACLAGCPVRAYDKDPATGIVRHLDDQCIGCRYCQLMCPYDVPTYSHRLGIVRKCDLCHDRLAEGEAPACVQGCPNEAISIALVETAPSDGGGAGAARLLPTSPGAMPGSELTRPTTRYVGAGRGERVSAAVLDPVDLANVEPAEGHTPLAVMLVLSQAAIGAVCVDTLLDLVFAGGPAATGATRLASAITLSIATVVGLSGLAASILHLGRPQWAFRAILGLRTSWMSREIVALGAFAGLLVGSCLLGWIDWAVATGRVAEPWSPFLVLRGPVVALACAFGALGLLCSIQIYAVTGRPLWRFGRTARRFVSTAAWAGVSVALLGSIIVSAEGAGISPDATQVALVGFLLALTFVRLRGESAARRDTTGGGPDAIALERTRRLLDAALARPARWRRRLLFAAGIVGPIGLLGTGLFADASVAGQGAAIAIATAIVLAGIASELLERSLFFRAEATPGMPGIA